MSLKPKINWNEKFKCLDRYPPWHNCLWARASSLSSLHSHTDLDTPHSVAFFRTSDRPGSEISTRQHTTLTRKVHPRPR